VSITSRSFQEMWLYFHLTDCTIATIVISIIIIIIIIIIIRLPLSFHQSPNIAFEWLAVLIRILEVLGPNHGPETGYPD
jgi:ABC-type phosphate/phosphonate transport system permease subunit